MMLVNIQSSALEVIEDVGAGRVPRESFWLSCKAGGSVVHSDVEVFNGDKVELRPSSDEIRVRRVGTDSLSIEYKGNEAILRFPEKHFTLSETPVPDITSMDVSPQEGLVVVGTSEGGVIVLGSDGSVRRRLGGHYLNTTKTLFFPSGEVVLSAGSDFQIKLWSAVDGSNPRTFMGHKGQITDLALVGRGRNFVSSGEDGSVRLWECGSGELVWAHEIGKGVKSIALGLNGTANGAASSVDAGPSGTLEFETADKRLFASTGDEVVAIDLGTKEEVGRTGVRDAHVLHVSGDGTLYYGTGDGHVGRLDAQTLESKGELISVSDTGVRQISSSADGHVYVVCNFDLVRVLLPTTTDQHSTVLLAGANEHTAAVAVGKSVVFTGGKHGTLRRYHK